MTNTEIQKRIKDLGMSPMQVEFLEQVAEAAYEQGKLSVKKQKWYKKFLRK